MQLSVQSANFTLDSHHVLIYDQSSIAARKNLSCQCNHYRSKPISRVPQQYSQTALWQRPSHSLCLSKLP